MNGGTTYYLGGVAYNMRVAAEHAVTLAELTSEIAMATIRGRLVDDKPLRNAWAARQPRLGGLVYRHTSLLPEGRRGWLQAILDEGHDGWAITVDADTWIAVGEAWRFLDALPPPTTDVALVGALVPCRDGRVNAWSAPGRRLAADELQHGKLFPVHAIGLALAAYNLRWYRGVDIRDAFAVVPTTDGGFISEDVWHCRWLEERGGKVLATADVPTRHGQ